MGEDDLIASFYEAATGAGSWPTALDRMARRLGCNIVQIIGVDMARQRLTYSHEGGDVPAGSVLDYALRYHRDDPHVPLVVNRPVAELVSFSHVFDDRFVAQNGFYQDFLIPYGVRHMHAAKLFDNGERAAMIGIMRPADRGCLEGEDWELARRLAFHVSRAVALYEVHTRDRAEVAIGQAVLDRLATPTWVLDDRRQVLRCNRAAQARVEVGSPLHRDMAGALRALDPADDARLGAALAAITSLADGDVSGREAHERAVLSLSPTRSRRPVVLRLLAIRADETLHAFGSSAVAMVMLHDAHAATLPDIFLLAAAFEFTPAEAKVALALAAGATPKEIAFRHSVSINTVQTQIRRACEKAGVGRTVDLVAALHVLAAGLSE